MLTIKKIIGIQIAVKRLGAAYFNIVSRKFGIFIETAGSKKKYLLKKMMAASPKIINQLIYLAP